jgi:glycosyltransferase involved in cell wall biosynthesis
VVIGVLTTSYPRGPGDFAGAFVADRVAALAAAGHRLEVLAGGSSARDQGAGGPVTVRRLPARFGDGPDLFDGAGAPEALQSAGVLGWLAAARFTAALAAVAAVRPRRWDRVESHWLLPSAFAALAGAPRLPHRAYAHSGDVALLERLPLGGTLARRLAASGGELVFASAALRGRFATLAGAVVGTVEAPPVPAALVPRGRTRADTAARRELGLDDAPVLVSVGRLVPIKGHDLLLRASASARCPAQVVLVGDGPERDRLRAMAARLGVALRLPGRVPRDRVAGWLRAADLYVQPSRVLRDGRTEGLPVATLEALAVGVPVVASDSGGLAELAGRPDLVLFPAGDAQALSRILGQLFVTAA